MHSQNYKIYTQQHRPIKQYTRLIGLIFFRVEHERTWSIYQHDDQLATNKFEKWREKKIHFTKSLDWESAVEKNFRLRKFSLKLAARSGCHSLPLWIHKTTKMKINSRTLYWSWTMPSFVRCSNWKLSMKIARSYAEGSLERSLFLP